MFTVDLKNYSDLSATTGSFFAALLEGIIPEISVRSTLIVMSIKAAGIGSTALRFVISVSALITALIGNVASHDTMTPRSPDEKPISIVSALNILLTFLFDAPIARRIPISFVRS